MGDELCDYCGEEIVFREGHMYHVREGWTCWNVGPDRTYTCRHCGGDLVFRLVGSHVGVIHEDGGWECWRQRSVA